MKIYFPIYTFFIMCMLSIGVYSQTYDDWRITYGLSAGSEYDNPDGDDYKNYEEYAFGLNPNTADAEGKKFFSATSGTSTLTIGSLKTTDLSYRIYHAADYSTDNLYVDWNIFASRWALEEWVSDYTVSENGTNTITVNIPSVFSGHKFKCEVIHEPSAYPNWDWEHMKFHIAFVQPVLASDVQYLAENGFSRSTPDQFDSQIHEINPNNKTYGYINSGIETHDFRYDDLNMEDWALENDNTGNYSIINGYNVFDYRKPIGYKRRQDITIELKEHAEFSFFDALGKAGNATVGISGQTNKEAYLTKYFEYCKWTRNLYPQINMINYDFPNMSNAVFTINPGKFYNTLGGLMHDNFNGFYNEMIYSNVDLQKPRMRWIVENWTRHGLAYIHNKDLSIDPSDDWSVFNAAIFFSTMGRNSFWQGSSIAIGQGGWRHPAWMEHVYPHRIGEPVSVEPTNVNDVYYRDFENLSVVCDVNNTTSLIKWYNNDGTLNAKWGNITDIPVTGLNISPANATIAVGEKQQMTTAISPSNAITKGVIWTSSNTTVARVDKKSGIVTALSNGVATITGKSVDGHFTKTSTITVTGDDINSPPTLSFATPLNNQNFNVGENISVTVAANDDGNILKVALYLDGILVGEKFATPYNWNTDSQLQNMTEGSYTLRAVATDDAGLTTEKSINIVVGDISVGPWNVSSLNQTPQWEVTTSISPVSGMTGIVYKTGMDYNGNEVDVFAYYSAPSGAMPSGGWPAVVHVPGGGGTAYPEWVNAWNEKGYACISIDVEGSAPGFDPATGWHFQPPNPGPSRFGVFDDWNLPIENQWYYHAVGQIIRANSLLRSLPEINSSKIGICGASWGGNLTSTAMGVDNRFAFAIPVYGAGYLAGSDGNHGANLVLGTAQTDFVTKTYTGEAYFDRVTYPSFWVNGTNDQYFAMTCTKQSASAVNGPATVKYQLRMPHGNFEILKYDEIYAFADQVTKGSAPIPVLQEPYKTNNRLYAQVTSQTPITSASIFYTLDDGNWIQRFWSNDTALVSGNTISGDIPTGAIAYYLSVTDSRGYTTTTKYLTIDDSEGGPISESNNLALNGIATQSSVSFDGPASLAIDGNTSGIYEENSVTHTNTELAPWWKVDIGEGKSIGEIVIYNRTDSCCMERLSNFTVSVINSAEQTTFSQSFTNFPNPSLSVNAGNAFGNVIKIELNGTETLSLAEVEVYEGESSNSCTSYNPNVSVSSNLITGINYSYYEGTWDLLPNFNSLLPVSSGITSGINLNNVETNDDYYGLTFDGFINIPSDGEYKFYTSSDDGSALYIDGIQVVINDGIHGLVEKSGVICLEAGYHKIDVQYFEKTGGSSLLVSYESASFAKKVITDFYVEEEFVSGVFPDPNKTYYIDSAIFKNIRLAASGESEDAYTVPIATTGPNVEWKFVAKGNGYWHIQRAAGGSKPRLRTDQTENADMQPITSSGTWTYYDLTEGDLPNSYFLTLPHVDSEYKRLQIDNTGAVKMVGGDRNGTWESFIFTEVESNASNAFSRIEAEDFDAMLGIQTQPNQDIDLTDNVGYINNGDWLRFDGVNLTGAQSVNLRVACNYTGGNIELRLGSVSGSIIGTAAVTNTGGDQEWITLNTSITNVTGIQDVYVVFTGGNGFLFNINWLEFSGNFSNKNIVENLSPAIIYPNPIISNATIINAKDSIVSFYDIKGKELFIKSITSERELIDFGSLSPGIYYAKIQGQNKISVIKIVKQ